jgi:hypothetical protein
MQRRTSFPELILELLLADVIRTRDAERYYRNFRDFERRRARIESRYDGQWVASINGRLIAAANLPALERKLRGKPHANRAYFEHVGALLILADGTVNDQGRMVIKVRLMGKDDYFVEKTLMADTGSPFTMIDLDNFKDLIRKGKAKPGKGQDTNFGPLIEIDGASMGVEVRDHCNEKDVHTGLCSKMWGSERGKDRWKKDFGKDVMGILGMDQFDELGADPAKSKDGKKSYLGKRH